MSMNVSAASRCASRYSISTSSYSCGQKIRFPSTASAGSSSMRIPNTSHTRGARRLRKYSGFKNRLTSAEAWGSGGRRWPTNRSTCSSKSGMRRKRAQRAKLVWAEQQRDHGQEHAAQCRGLGQHPELRQDCERDGRYDDHAYSNVTDGTDGHGEYSQSAHVGRECIHELTCRPGPRDRQQPGALSPSDEECDQQQRHCHKAEHYGAAGTLRRQSEGVG